MNASVKARLIESLRAEQHACRERLARIEYQLRELSGRGSGPLPRHYVDEAKRRGIIV